MTELKTLETKSNEVLLPTLRVSSMPSSAGTDAASKSKLMKIAKKQAPSTKKIQLCATTKLGISRSATTTKRTSSVMQYED